jgi:NCS1 nucleoside transporter family
MATQAQGAVHDADIEVRPGHYGAKVGAVEPGGAEFIPIAERHGRPLDLLWTWASPNLEFATVFIGVLAVVVFKENFWQATLGILLGTTLGSVAHGLLSARGPRHGVPQMVLARVAFGYWGNTLPAALMSITAGIGWFAVNSVSGTFALNALLGWPKLICLLIVVAAQLAIAFYGYNLVQVFERYALPFLAVVFAVAAVVILAKSHPGAPGHGGGPGGFLLTAGAAFGYAAGWNPYAADYTRYLPADASPRRTGWYAGLGLFVSCLVLEVVGAAAVTVGPFDMSNPTGAFTAHLATWLADVTLLAIALGAVSANVLNIYSGAMAFVAMGVKLPGHMARAITAVVFGVVGFVVAWTGLQDVGARYEAFLLVIAYWIGPWLGVMFADHWLRRGSRIDGLLFDTRHRNWAGPVALVAGAGVSIWLFAAQQDYTGLVAKAVPQIGDIAFLVGFVLAAGLYVGLFTVTGQRRAARPERPERFATS